MANETPLANQSLPLTALHVAAGATVERFRDGIRRPAHFGDLAAEERALHETVGLADVSGDDHVDVTGPDRIAFLQGMVTNDLKALSVGEGCRTAWLTAKARVQMVMGALLLPDRVRLVLPPGGADSFLPAIDRYLIMEDAAFERVDPPVMLAVDGPGAPALLSALTGLNIDRLSELARFPGTLAHLDVEVSGIPAKLVSRSVAIRGGVELWTSAASGPDLFAALRAAGEGEEHGLTLVGTQAREAARIASGALDWGAEIEVDTFMPELPMTDWVSFKKGCYLGQEPVARVHFRGRPARQVASLELDGDASPEPGSAVFSATDRDRAVGRVTSVARSEWRARTVALALLRVDYLEPGTRLDVALSSAPDPASQCVTATVVDAPGTAAGRVAAKTE